jgi:hypothetical protein
LGAKGKWKRWSSGIFLENIGKVKFMENRVKAGIALRLVDEFVLVFDYYKELGRKRWENFSIGVECSFGGLSFRAGTLSESKILTSGIGFRWGRNFSLDYAYILHPALPSTHQFTLTLTFH